MITIIECAEEKDEDNDGIAGASNAVFIVAGKCGTP